MSIDDESQTVDPISQGSVKAGMAAFDLGEQGTAIPLEAGATAASG